MRGFAAVEKAMGNPGLKEGSEGLLVTRRIDGMSMQGRCRMHYCVKQRPQRQSNPIKCWSLGCSRGIPCPSSLLRMNEKLLGTHVFF